MPAGASYSASWYDRIIELLQMKIITADKAEQMLNGVEIDIESRLEKQEPLPPRVIRTE